MITIEGRNVEENWALFKTLMRDNDWAAAHTRKVSPRGKLTVEIVGPVSTLYHYPTECVLLDPTRDANPFFHLYEALWVLGGFEDVSRVARYAKHISTFSDDGKTFYGSYGARMRYRFGVDQVGRVIDALKEDPDSRRAVIGLWNPSDLLVEKTLDLPCNTTLYFKLRDGALQMTVCNRSNDAIWGCYGANAVHFSILQQYIAGALGAGVGSYHQVSDSLHVYLNSESSVVWDRVKLETPTLFQDYSYAARGLANTPLLADRGAFDSELAFLLKSDDGRIAFERYEEPFLQNVVVPMFWAYELYRSGQLDTALTILNRSTEAWHVAGLEWIRRRAEARAARRA